MFGFGCSCTLAMILGDCPAHRLHVFVFLVSLISASGMFINSFLAGGWNEFVSSDPWVRRPSTTRSCSRRNQSACRTVPRTDTTWCPVPPFAVGDESVAEFCGYPATAVAPPETEEPSEFLGELRHAPITDGSIGYYRFGNSSSDRPPLVMITGFGNTMGSWEADFLEELARHQELIIFDNRGMGESEVCKGERK